MYQMKSTSSSVSAPPQMIGGMPGFASSAS